LAREHDRARAAVAVTTSDARADRRKALADQRWRAFCRALGYPDPDRITQERTVWSAGEAQTGTSRICSASSTGKTAVTSPEIRQIVQDVYSHHLEPPPDWTPAQRETFIETEAARISRQIADLADQMGAQSVTEWTARTGAHPDYLTTVGLLNTAMSAAKEVVLNNELYELIPQPADPPSDLGTEPPTLDHSQVPWDQRWTRPQYRSDPSEQIEDLVAQIWPGPDFSAVFRIKAGYLLAARAEDQLPLPGHRGYPLADELAQMVYSDLRRDGLPER
jgi:hypothetical protein